MEKPLSISALFDLSHTLAALYLRSYQYPWEALGGIGQFLEEYTKMLPCEYVEVCRGAFVHKSAKLAESAKITGTCIIGANAQVRHGAFLRGNVIVGAECVVGNSTELKNCILFDRVQVPHFNYVGDSILGYKAHLGAGAICSNVRADRAEVVVHGDKDYFTHLKKCGAFVGDGVEVGCNSVLCPGTVLGKNTTVYPLTFCRGVYPPDSRVKP